MTAKVFAGEFTLLYVRRTPKKRSAGLCIVPTSTAGQSWEHYKDALGESWLEGDLHRKELGVLVKTNVSKGFHQCQARLNLLTHCGGQTAFKANEQKSKCWPSFTNFLKQTLKGVGTDLKKSCTIS